MFKRIVLIVVVLAALGGGGYFAYQRFFATKTSTTANLNTATVQRGNLTASVTGSGSLASPQSASLEWQIAGTVGQVNVKVGQVVTAGQVLMQLDPTKLDTSIVQAQAALLTDQQALVDLTTPVSATALANAQLTIIQDTQAITSAQRTLRNALNPVGQSLYDAVTTAEVALHTAQANAQLATVSTSVQQYTNGYWKTDYYWKVYQDLQAKYEAAPNPDSLKKAQSAYNDWKVLADQQAQYQLTSQTDQENKNLSLSQAQTAYDEAVANLNAAKAGPDSATVTLARQKLAVAQAQLETDQQALATLQAGPTEAQLAAAKAKIAVDQATLDKLQIVAPFTGTVVAVSSQVGDPVSSGTAAVQLADLSSLQVQVSVSELDINRVKLAQQVDLTLDALSEDVYTGTVTEISYLGTTSSGVVNFPVTVVISDPDAALKSGMTASAAIVTDQRVGVLLVPNRALHVSNNQHTVTVLYEGQQIPVTVEVGLSGDTMTEITGGQLKEGDTVVLSSTTTSSSSISGGGFDAGPGGGPLG